VQADPETFYIMPTKHCVFGDCKSDSRFHPWLKWAAFVKPTKPKNIDRAKRWIYLLKREDFSSIDKISGNTYICEKHFPEEDHENLDWRTNHNLEPIPPNAVTKRGARDISPVKVVKVKRPESKYNLADLTQYQWYVCPEDTCLYQSQNSSNFEQHMWENHECTKAKKIKLNISGEKTMTGRREQKSFETSFEAMPKNVRDDFENHQLLQMNESLDVLPGNLA